MKDQARILGIDDGAFVKGAASVPLVGVLVCPPSYVEGIMVSACQVDGDDANSVLFDMIDGSRFRDQIRMVMIDGVAFGGFNVVDIQRLSRELHVPVVTVTREMPDPSSICTALRAHFSDWERRLDIISSTKMRKVLLPEGQVFIASSGLEENEVDAAVQRSTVRGCLPEPVRIAHLVATALVRGESKGRA